MTGMQWVGDNCVPLDSRVSSVAETASFLFSTNPSYFLDCLILEVEIYTPLLSQQNDSVFQCVFQIWDSNKIWAVIKLLVFPLHFSYCWKHVPDVWWSCSHIITLSFMLRTMKMENRKSIWYWGYKWGKSKSLFLLKIMFVSGLYN